MNSPNFKSQIGKTQMCSLFSVFRVGASKMGFLCHLLWISKPQHVCLKQQRSIMWQWLRFLSLLRCIGPPRLCLRVCQGGWTCDREKSAHKKHGVVLAVSSLSNSFRRSGMGLSCGWRFYFKDNETQWRIRDFVGGRGRLRKISDMARRSHWSYSDGDVDLVPRA